MPVGFIDSVLPEDVLEGVLSDDVLSEVVLPKDRVTVEVTDKVDLEVRVDVTGAEASVTAAPDTLVVPSAARAVCLMLHRAHRFLALYPGQVSDYQ